MGLVQDGHGDSKTGKHPQLSESLATEELYPANSYPSQVYGKNDLCWSKRRPNPTLIRTG
ncbi:hypothetical protein JMJ77_0011975 [Colletotrichum scovillei]|uniref:Uncharacterized protein n=1 Tax=Colletotrichum scovillei TaxID=1209932 RepID=A0A9P7QWY0_9PEZI|nr:hypothetical protein JMJ77_0011975 [Colletotrichum scovillei]KAG7046305.1 hypothetical protein JMJ78_0011369 [Colletotrichum scovillei]KAG7063610.1 hypothetical protein JMJ76_0006072 [Colletotrichum scovillei]